MQCLVLAALMTGAMGLYSLILRLPTGEVRSTRTFLDAFVPFWPAWTWVYLLPYVVAPALAAALPAPAFRALCRRALVLLGLSFAVFLLAPTEVQRPDLSSLDDDLTAALYRAMIAFDDPPRNALPSLHAGLAVVFGAALWSLSPRSALAGAAFAALVCLSTLFSGQHHVLDVVAGVALALAVVAGVRAAPAPLSVRAGRPRQEPG